MRVSDTVNLSLLNEVAYFPSPYIHNYIWNTPYTVGPKRCFIEIILMFQESTTLFSASKYTNSTAADTNKCWHNHSITTCCNKNLNASENNHSLNALPSQ
jgi:hypothetical protein